MLKPQEEGVTKIQPFVPRGSVEDLAARWHDPFAGFGFEGGFSSSMFDPGKPFAVRSDPIKLTARADPNSSSGQNQWLLPAKDVRLNAEWCPVHPVFRDGKAVGRRTSLLALGASVVQLPNPSFENMDGAQIYLYDVQTGEDQTTEGTITRKDFFLSVVLTRGDKIKQPEIKVNLTDSVFGEAKMVTLPNEFITDEGTVSLANQPVAATPKVAPATAGVRKQDRPDGLAERRKRLALASAKENPAICADATVCVLAWRRLAGGDPAMIDAAREAIAALEKAVFAPAAKATEVQTRHWLNVLAKEDHRIVSTQSRVQSRLPSLYPA